MSASLRRGGNLARLGTTVAVVGCAGATLTSMATGAFFTSTASVAANTFTTGTVVLTASPATAAITFTNMAPGDVVTAPVTVSNTGTLAYRYAVLGTTTEALLSAQLDMTVKSGVTTCTTAGFGATGTAAYGPADLGSSAGTKVIGDAAQGSQTGDRTLVAGASEVLCVQVILPFSTDNTFQGKTTTATFRFDAEQTANNA